MRQIILTVVLTINDDCDPFDVVSEMDYDFSHPDVVDSEITDSFVD